MIKRAGLALGFTLIEMGIVLVVIGLVLSGGLVAVAPVIQNSKNAETNQKLDRIEQALILHVIRFGCLPCPALGTTASSATAAGYAAANATTYSTGCAAGACTVVSPNQGVVPWVNLGLSESDATDGFGMRITYVLTTANSLHLSGNMVRTPPSSYPAGDLTVNNIAGTTTITSTGAYVLISHGKDRVWGYIAGTGTRLISDPNASTPQAANGDGSPFVQDDYVGVAGTGYFDDIVRWRNAPLIIQLCGTNACGNPA